MKICFIDLKELIVLLTLKNHPRLSTTLSPFIIVFEARWNLHRPNGLENFLKLFDNNDFDDVASFDTIIAYALITNGNDDIEDFIINNLNIKNLPYLINPNYFNDNIFQLIDRTNMTTSSMLYNLMSSSKATTSIPMQLYVAGDRSSVGKSSICLCILATLIHHGISPSDIAYIKPVTQCEAEQPITRFCHALGIEECSIGPVVFYTGFTRAFLAGQTDNSVTLLNQVQQAVHRISHKKQFVLIDGVGYPSVGSICGLSNADVAVTLKCPVILVGKSGVGDAVDCHNLNSSYFEARSVKVLGAIFNKLSTDLSSFYNLQTCGEAVRSYFQQFKSDQKVYGFIPLVHFSPSVAMDITAAATTDDDDDDDDATIRDNNNNRQADAEAVVTTTTVPAPAVPSSAAVVTKAEITTPSYSLLQTALSVASPGSDGMQQLFEQFLEHFDVQQLMMDVWRYQLEARAVSVHEVYTPRQCSSHSSSHSRRHSQPSAATSSSSGRNRGANNSSSSSSNSSNKSNNSNSSSSSSKSNSHVSFKRFRATDDDDDDTGRMLSSSLPSSLLISNNNAENNSNNNQNNKRVRTREEILQSAAQSGACVTGG